MSEALSDEQLDILGGELEDAEEEHDQQVEDELPEGDTDEAESEDEESEEEAPKVDDKADDDEEAEPIDTLDKLAEALETDVSQLSDNFKVRVNVDGVPTEVNLAEALRGYSRQSDYDQRLTAHKQAQQQFEQERSQTLQQINGHAQQQLQWVTQIETALLGELDIPAIQALQSSPDVQDQVRGMQLYQQHQERVQQLQTVKANLAQTQQQAHAQMQQQQQAAAAEQWKTESEALMKAWPEFSNQESKDRLMSYLTNDMGISPDVVNSVTDHKFYLLAEKARQFDATQKGADAVKKAVKKVPKLVSKPGKGASKQQHNSLKKARAVKKARSSGSINDAADRLLATGLID